MKRFIDKYLLDWSQLSYRKSLLLRGARQTGKTYAVRTLAKSFDSYVEINFELTPEAGLIFEKNLYADRLIRDLSLFTGKRIEPGKTLLFLDEVQGCPQAVTALRYFYENAPALHVIAAGSHLTLAFEAVGVPVGRVSMLTMHPLSFLEFLCASGNSLLAKYIMDHNPNEKLNSAIHQKALDLLGQFQAVGGMPESVAAWIDHQDLETCRHISLDIVKSYRQDLDKYGTKTQQKYIAPVFEAIPSQMGTKFRYHAIHGEYRKSQLAPALDLLVKLHVATKVCHSDGQGPPLGATIHLDHFKVILIDVALAQVMQGLSGGEWILHARDMLENKGEITEAFIGQELLAYRDAWSDGLLYYWHRESRSSNAEIDYMIQQNSTIIPIEVKSGSSGWLKSMHKFLEEHPNSPYGLRFHGGDHHIDGKIKSYPLYAVASALGIERSLLDFIATP